MNGAYCEPFKFDGRIAPDKYVSAEEIDNIWHPTTAPIRVRCEKEIFPEGGSNIVVPPHEEITVVAELDKIYAGFIHAHVKTDGVLEGKVVCRELDEKEVSDESFVFDNYGRMFHTTYSLIWVRMLYDVYMLTGNIELLQKCEDALILLLNRFETYLGDNGLIETPPDYMFVDWIYIYIYIDELSMHHPPKCLGQTCLNMFYFSALEYAAKIYDVLGESSMEDACTDKKEKLRQAVNNTLFCEEKGLYFEGLNTKTPDELLGQYMPQNVEKRYYLKHSNILAACFGVCDTERARDLIEKVMTDECPGVYQPYFAHFLLEAIYKNGLRDKYTLEVVEKWKKTVEDCEKGLVEGFIAPEPTYSFDHSHAWGGTPLYSVPKALLGLEILKPGFSKIELDPCLCGLGAARVELPTPYGMVTCELKKDEAPVISAPEQVKIILKDNS